MKLIHSLPLIALAAAITSCSDDNWRLNGNVAGADAGTTLIVETSDNGRWYAVDTLRTSATGDFSMKAPAPRRPGVYRLRLGDKCVYFPIDSLETITITTGIDSFDTDYKLSGSDEADLMEALDKEIMKGAAASSPARLVTDSLFKREIGRKLLANPSGIVAYYIVNKQVGGIPLFNPENRFDRRIIGAVANAYEEKRPGDPRTAFLRNRFMTGRKGSPLVAGETRLLELNLYSPKGTRVSLDSLAAANHVVVLNFTTQSAPDATAFNNELHKIWSAHRTPGTLAIYQVSVNDSERQWIDVSRNLPWTSVYLPDTEGADLLKYNVTYLPTSFVIVDSQLRTRADSPEELRAALAPYL